MEEDYRYWSDLRSPWMFSKGLCRVSRDYYLDLVKRYQSQSFLDLGCGFGETYNVFQKNKVELHYVGIDIIPGFIRSCKERYPDADFQIGLIQEIPYPDNSFNMVSCRCVLEHLPDPDPAIKEMARVSSGMVVIVWFKFPGDGERFLYKEKRGFWENKYSRDKILDTAGLAGLHLVDDFFEQWHWIWVLEKD